MNAEIKHYKVLALPLRPVPNSVYYVLNTVLNKVEGYITDLNGIPIKFIDLTGGGGGGTVDIASLISTEIGNRIRVSIQDGKLFVEPLTSSNSSITIDGSNIQLSEALSNQIAAALTTADLNGYATESWVQSQNYLTTFIEADPIFNTWLSTNPFSGYATESWVNSQGYLTGFVESDPVFSTWLGTNPLAGYALTSSLSAVATSGQYSDLSGIPSTFAPSAHSHPISDVTNLQTVLDGKVTGIALSTDNNIPRFDGTTGKLIQASGVSIDDNGGLIVSGVSGSTFTAKKIEYDNTSNQWIAYDNDSTTAMNIGYEIWVTVKNSTGSTIPNGSVVYVTGTDGVYPTVALARSDSASTTVSVGITTQAIANGAIGKVTQAGVVRGVNTSGLTGGAVYLSSTVAGGLTNTSPTNPNYRMRVGFVGAIDAVNGTILVTPSTASQPTIGTGGLMAESVTNYKFVAYDQNILLPMWGTNNYNVVSGNNMTLAGGNVGRNFADTNFFTRKQRVGYITSTTPSTANTGRQILGYFTRNGGFEFYTEIGSADNANLAGSTAFFGAATPNNTNAANLDPTTLVNALGIARIASSNNWHILHNDAAGTAVTVDMGVNFPANTINTDWYTVKFKTVVTGIEFIVNRYNSAGVISHTYSYTATTEIPAASFVMAGWNMVSNGVNGVAVAVDWAGQYVKIGN